MWRFIGDLSVPFVGAAACGNASSAAIASRRPTSDVICEVCNMTWAKNKKKDITEEDQVRRQVQATD